MEIESKSNPQQEKESFWKNHIKQWEESNLPQRIYCSEAKINYGTFGYWRNRFSAESGKIKRRQFLPVKIENLSPVKTESIKIKMLSGNIILIPLSIGISETVKLILQLEKVHA